MPIPFVELLSNYCFSNGSLFFILWVQAFKSIFTTRFCFLFLLFVVSIYFVYFVTMLSLSSY